jgi:hypothetical protein
MCLAVAMSGPLLFGAYEDGCVRCFDLRLPPAALPPPSALDATVPAAERSPAAPTLDPVAVSERLSDEPLLCMATAADGTVVAGGAAAAVYVLRPGPAPVCGPTRAVVVVVAAAAAASDGHVGHVWRLGARAAARRRRQRGGDPAGRQAVCGRGRGLSVRPARAAWPCTC